MGITIIGRFSGVSDGQTVKTEALYNALKRYSQHKLHCADTYYVKRKPWKFIGELIRALILDQKIIVMVSDNGRRILFPFLYYASRFLGKKVFHYAIGGRLAQEIEQKPKWKKYVSGFCGNWMESFELVGKLQRQGIRNAVYLPNFKRLNILTEAELHDEFVPPFKLCTFSRVQEKKGIEDALRAVEEINHASGKELVVLDIYGPAEAGYMEKLSELLQNSSACRYGGVIPADQSVETLRNYYALLFPTHYRLEGIPGTIIDALSAGVPVIARKWQYCDEMLKHGVTGYLYDFDQPGKLKDMILYATEHVSETVQMKKNCIAKAADYTEEKAIEMIARHMGI